MPYVGYTDSGFTNPVIIDPVPVGDMSIGTATDWNANIFDVGDVECHTTPCSDFGIDYTFVTPAMLQPSVTLYFTSGWTLTLTHTRIDAMTMDYTNFGGITAGDTVIGGPTGTASNPIPLPNVSSGFLVLKSTVYVDGVPHNCIVFALGWSPSTGGFISAFSPRAISIEALEATQTDPQGGIPQQPEGGNGKYRLNGETLSFGDAGDRSDDMGGGGLVAGTQRGTHLYEIDATAMSDFLTTCYGGTGDFSFESLWTSYKNSMHDPLSGILGALIIPATPTTTTIGYIALSGQSIKVGGTCGYVSSRFGETGEATLDMSDFTYYDTYLDYEPYTKITLYLPFIGSVGINTNECMGGEIGVNYWIDFATGNCVAYVRLTDRHGMPSYYQYSGNCAAFVPISGNDAGISSIISGAASFISGTVQAMSGNPAGLAGMVTGAAAVAEPKTTQKHVGGFSGGSGCIGCLYPYIVINQPAAATPEGYTSIMGAISAQTGIVSDYAGYTRFLHCDTHGVPATQSEISEIENALRDGVYI